MITNEIEINVTDKNGHVYYFTPTEYAKYLGVSRPYVYDLLCNVEEKKLINRHIKALRLDKNTTRFLNPKADIMAIKRKYVTLIEYATITRISRVKIRKLTNDGVLSMINRGDQTLIPFELVLPNIENEENLQNYYRIPEVVAMTKYNKKTIYICLEKKFLKGFKFGNYWYIDKEQFQPENIDETKILLEQGAEIARAKYIEFNKNKYMKKELINERA